jgi:quinol monooxygenase YgiN
LITFIIHLGVRPENAAAFEELLADVAATSNEREPGVVYYAFSKSVDEPDTYMTVEVYRDQEAVAAHGAAPWVTESIPKMLELIEGMPRIVQYVSPGTEPVGAQFEELT